MTALRVGYRARQFWLAVQGRPDAPSLERARQVLSSAQFELFRQLQPSEQAHALDVLARIEAASEAHPDLLVAALLHDIGKTRYPLRLWERALIVLVKKLSAARLQAWGQGSARGWRPFVVAVQHPAWGAEMAAKRGVSPLAVSLIRRHQDSLARASQSLEDRLLAALQAADDES